MGRSQVACYTSSMSDAMFVIDVIPLIFIPRNQAQVVSYFYSKPLQKGAVVEIPYGRRKVTGVVLELTNVAHVKLTLRKQSGFELKHISSVQSTEPQVADWQLSIARTIATEYYASLGITLKTVLPPFWLKKNYPLKPLEIESPKTKVEPKLIKTSLKNHAQDYESDRKSVV